MGCIGQFPIHGNIERGLDVVPEARRASLKEEEINFELPLGET